MKKTAIFIFILLFAGFSASAAFSTQTNQFMLDSTLIALETTDSIDSASENSGLESGPAESTSAENPQPALVNPPETLAEPVVPPSINTRSRTGAGIPAEPVYNADGPSPENPINETSALDNQKTAVSKESSTKTDITVPELLNSWWGNTPSSHKYWLLIFGLSIFLYSIKQYFLRKTILFGSLILLGFYLKLLPDPIASLFDLPTGNISLLFLILIPLVTTLIFGRIFCSWVCPIGALQELLHPEKSISILPERADHYLKILKYIILLVLVGISWWTGTNIWAKQNPAQILFTFEGTSFMFYALLIMLIGSLLIERVFCRYLCPLGAILAVFSRFAFLKVKPDFESCTACAKCTDEVCPMRTITTNNRYLDLPRIKYSECINCMRCASGCHQTALTVSGPFRIKPISKHNQDLKG